MRFCVVGAVNTGIDFGVFFCLFYILGWPLLMAHGLAFSVAVVNSYLLNKFWSFGEKDGVSATQALRFFAVNGSGLLVSSVVIYAAGFYMPVWAAKIVAIGASLIWNYGGSSLFVFRRR